MTSPVSVLSLDDDALVQFINGAETSLHFLSPGISLKVADALARKWVDLGPDAVSIVLDIDPDVCRVGYGVMEGIEKLRELASRLGCTIHHRPGLRIGVLTTESTTLVFAPIPLLIQAESIEFPRPNAVSFRATPNEPALAKTFIHIEKEVEDLKQDSEPVTEDKLEEVSQDLASNPPLKFDLARVVRVFNAQFQFVEFELTGFMISKMSVPIPADLMGLAKDDQTRKLLRSTFKLVRDDCEISGRSILEAKKKISKDYLVSLKGFGRWSPNLNSCDRSPFSSS